MPRDDTRSTQAAQLVDAGAKARVDRIAEYYRAREDDPSRATIGQVYENMLARESARPVPVEPPPCTSSAIRALGCTARAAAVAAPWATTRATCGGDGAVACVCAATTTAVPVCRMASRRSIKATKTTRSEGSCTGMKSPNGYLHAAAYNESIQEGREAQRGREAIEKMRRDPTQVAEPCGPFDLAALLGGDEPIRRDLAYELIPVALRRVPAHESELLSKLASRPPRKGHCTTRVPVDENEPTTEEASEPPCKYKSVGAIHAELSAWRGCLSADNCQKRAIGYLSEQCLKLVTGDLEWIPWDEWADLSVDAGTIREILADWADSLREAIARQSRATRARKATPSIPSGATTGAPLSQSAPSPVVGANPSVGASGSKTPTRPRNARPIARAKPRSSSSACRRSCCA